MASSGIHLTTLGHRIRHHRLANGYTLDELGSRVGVAGSQLSLIENGKREPKLSLLQSIALATGTEVADLISSEPPNHRAALEIELERAQESPVFRQLGIAPVRVTKGMSDETIESLLGLHRELQRREREAIATPEEARRANTELRLRMRAQNNYLGDIERRDLCDAVDQALVVEPPDRLPVDRIALRLGEAPRFELQRRPAAERQRLVGADRQ